MQETGSKTPWTVEVGEFTAPDGEVSYYEKFQRKVPITTFVTSPIIGDACKDCDEYGKNFGCPPYSPQFEDYSARSTQALVISVRVPMEHFKGDTLQDRYRQCFNAGRRLLLDQLYKWREKGKQVGGSGPCMGCSECSLTAAGNECRLPEKRIFSLEAMGVNVVELLKTTFDQDLEWAGEGGEPSSISAIGAVFL